MRKLIFILFLAPFFLQAQEVEEQLSAHIFPSVEDARILIVKDDVEDFFGKINSLDMALQLGDENVTDSAYLQTFLDYLVLLQKEVIPFSVQEQIRVRSLVSRAELEIMQINEKLFPDTVYLVKIQGLAYGPGAFYTRENVIYIPGNLVGTMGDEDLYGVILHELFHIISRYNPDMKAPLYALAGFEPLRDSLCLPEAVERRLLLNPDGIDMDYTIDLPDEDGQMMTLLPLLVSNAGSYRPERPGFFRYLAFQLYPVVDRDEHCKTLAIDPGGFSAIGREIMNAYQEKVGDITRYTIHPNEILAEYFSELVIAEGIGNYGKFSERGKVTLSRMLNILRDYGN